jgi:hypothetical protein
MRTSWVLAVAVIGTIGVPANIAAGLPPPLVEIQADCATGLTVMTSGYPEGDGWLVIGGEPQRTFTRNATVTTAWPLSLAGMYDYTVIAIPGNGEAIQGHLDCVVVPASPPIEPDPVIVEPEAPTFAPHPIWPGLELAPPW